ncbi:hypothetical protein OVA24_21245 [Luteolibacter sp. SL250]|uniref:hypothetical protein n=1 Tax=Luteolibacter sp. SL250 TaxID=2995170 RepID=UPI002270251D|nr:hypothetical protein [Luteolibacter sp. SL250]WAC19748.1 hypothetical protein OVA24_21245 [Luteolibacter sp. SL250]
MSIEAKYEMILPIIVKADDGVKWWMDPVAAGGAMESPDIEAGIYSAWDSRGQMIHIGPMDDGGNQPRNAKFMGIWSHDVTCGKLLGSGIQEPEALRQVILFHLTERLSANVSMDMSLAAAVDLLCFLEPAANS